LRKLWLAADDRLAVMSFEPEQEVMVRTSFTTKLLDYCRFGKPVILWGPDYCASIRVAKKKNAAITFLKFDVEWIIYSLHRQHNETDLAENLAIVARGLADHDLRHKTIHREFFLKITKLKLFSNEV
jgi:hypothetical protein